jgi:hypothetical protein
MGLKLGLTANIMLETSKMENRFQHVTVEYNIDVCKKTSKSFAQDGPKIG